MRNMTAEDIVLVKKFLKERLKTNNVNFHGNAEKWQNIRNLLLRTSEGESNSILLTGPRGSGKTTLLNSVLHSLIQETQFIKNTIIVYLNGLIETDDKLALKSITAQLNLENLIDGRIFGSFSENLSFLLSCLSNTESKKSKSVIFILEEFDLFCHHHGQTLLYNLFDISQSAQAPICVVGITCRLDVIELLEKRVKSRYSHRQIYLFNNPLDSKTSIELFRQYLMIPSKEYFENSKKNKVKATQAEFANSWYLRRIFNPNKYNFNNNFCKKWNENIENFLGHATTRECIEGLIEYDLSEDLIKKLIFRFISTLNANHSVLLPEDFALLCHHYNLDDKIAILTGLSVLELCLVISIKHHCEIYDYDPFNFEIIFTRFLKFASKTSIMQSVERPVALKAFEHLKSLELILPINSTTSKVRKEFQMHRMALTFKQINQGVNHYTALPTEVSQWGKSCII